MASTDRDPPSSHHDHLPVPHLTSEPPLSTSAPASPRNSLLRTQQPTPSNEFGGLAPSFSTSGLLRRQRSTSIRLRRQPSAQQLNQRFNAPDAVDGVDETGGRRRSLSEPQRPPWFAGQDQSLARQSTITSQMPEISEDHAEHHTVRDVPASPSKQDAETQKPTAPHSRLRAATAATAAGPRQMFRRLSSSRVPHAAPSEPATRDAEYESSIVDLLDVVDPEVSTLSTLTNVQNSLFIPDLGRWLNRRPTYEFSPQITEASTPISDTAGPGSIAPSGTTTLTEPLEPKAPVLPKAPVQPKPPRTLELEPSEAQIAAEPIVPQERLGRSLSISSHLSESRFAVLPHGVTLVGWSDEDKELLNDHVRHMLHSKRSAFKRSMKGFVKYVQRPLGFFVTLYATLITLFGLAWVLFLIGWINVGGKQYYVINVIDNVLVALFAIMGDGLAPFRAVDTYHMIFIAHYHYLTWKLRKKQSLPDLQNHNDLPTETPTTADIEAGMQEKMELSVLTPKQQARLDYHAGKYSRSHTFYKPHETDTHYAFPVKLLITVTVLLDFHSIFQIALGACTWGINYHHRPQALTATILSCSITCNISAGITIAIGDRLSRKKEIVEERFRQGLTKSAIKQVQKERKKDIEAGVPDVGVPQTHIVVTEEQKKKDDEPLDDEHNQLVVVETEDDAKVERERTRRSLSISRAGTPSSSKDPSRNASTSAFPPLPPMPTNLDTGKTHSRNISTSALPPLPTSPPPPEDIPNYPELVSKSTTSISTPAQNKVKEAEKGRSSGESSRRRSLDSDRRRRHRSGSWTRRDPARSSAGSEPFPPLPDTPTMATSPTVKKWQGKNPGIELYPGT